MTTRAENLANLAAAFLGDAANQSLAANGYQKLPSGLIIQWQKVVAHTGGTNVTAVTFPIPFPNACLFIGATQLASAGGGAEVTPCPSDSPTLTGANVYFTLTSSSVFSYLAIGF